MVIRSAAQVGSGRSGSNELAAGSEVSQKVGGKWRNFGNAGMERTPLRRTPNENLFRLPRAGEMVYTACHFLKSKGRLVLDSSPLLKSLLSISLSLLLAATPLYAASADTQTAGEVKALIPAASRNAQPVNIKDSLNWNDLLKTDTQGRLRAGLTAGSILSLGSNSELQVGQHDAVSQQTSIVVNYGKL